MNKENEKDIKWIKNLKALKDFMEKYNTFPGNCVVHNGYPIGKWLDTQRRSYRKGILSKERIHYLDSINPIWKGDRKEENKRLLISSDWKSKVPEGNTPIDEYYKDTDNLFICLYNEIYDCETLLERSYDRYIVNKKLSYFNKYDCFCKIKPFLDPNSLHLMCNIYGFKLNEFVESRKKWVDTFAVLSPEDMHDKMVKMVDKLPQNKRDIVYLRYGLNGNEKHQFHEIAKINNSINKNDPCNINRRTLEYLRQMFTDNDELIFNTGTFLDDPTLTISRGILYRLGITSDSQLSEYIETEKVDPKIKVEIINFLNLLQKRDKLNKVQLIDIGISNRACKCLKYANINTLPDLIKISKDRENLLKIRGIGFYLADEIILKIDTYLEKNNLKEII